MNNEKMNERAKEVRDQKTSYNSFDRKMSGDVL